MFPYFCLLCIPLAYSIYSTRGIATFESRFQTKESYNTIGAFFAILTIMLMLRDPSCGVDTRSYKYFFNKDIQMSMKTIMQSYNFELGFHYLNKLISFLSTDFRVYVAVTAVMSIVPIWIYYARNSDIPYLTIILFVTVAPYNMFFSGIRQALAIAVSPIAYSFVRDKKLVKFILSVIFASLFHQSALILFLMYPVYRAKFTRKWIWFVIPLMLIVLALNDRIFSAIAPLMGERYYERYGEMTSTRSYTTIILLFVFSVFTAIIPDKDKVDEETTGMRNLLFLSTCLQCFAPINTVAMRMNYYYLIFIPILITKIITRSKSTTKQISYISYVVMCIVFFVYFFYNAYNGSDILQIFPYVPFWQS